MSPPHDLTSTPNKWVVAVTVMFGTFMAVIDVSVVNVALPHMMGTFGQDLSSITWVATSYSIAQIVTISMTGWLSTLVGRRRLYLLSFGLFTVGSMLCGTAHTFTQMLVYRIIQGVGSGALVPVSQAILRESFPQEEQGMAMAVYGMGVVLAPAMGPILGGWLTDHFGWPWIFYINVPISIVGMFMVSTFIHDPPYLRRGIRQIDWLGIILLIATLTTMQLVLERGQEENWFESKLIAIGLTLCMLSLAALVLQELRVNEPIVNFRLLRNIPLTVGSSMGVAFGIALFGTTFILPQFTQKLLGYSAFEAGMVLAPRAITLLIFMPVAGMLYRYVDARLLVLGGIFIIFWAYYDLAHLSLQIGFWNFVPMLLIMGAGMPFMFVTLTAVSLSSVAPEDMTEASSIYTLARRVGGNIGYALAATLVARGQRIHRVNLIDHVSIFDPIYQDYHRHITTVLTHAGLSPTHVGQAIHALTNSLINRQATILAYNDLSWIFGALFLLMIPLLLLVPGRHKQIH